MSFKKMLAMSMFSASAIAMAPTVLAQDTIANETSVEEPKTLDTIVVTGIRQSLKEAADLKRSSSQIVDAIVSEDIGKLPDNNIAEALQRITGVSINSDFGVGETVSIRGLSENRVELNGRTTVGDGRDGISLDDFPSSFLRSVEVVKSPTADMIEGALGGTVRMNTIRPMELDGLTIAGSLDAEYSDKTEHIAPIANISIGNVWDVGNSSAQFGVIGSLSYQDREIRQDESFGRVRLYSENVNGMTANTPSGAFAVRDQNTVQQFVQQRERTAANLSFQFSPSDKGQFYLDLSMTDRSGEESGSSILDDGGTRVYDASTTQDANGYVSNYKLENLYLIPKAFSEFRNTESFSHALGGEWNFTDTIKVSGEYSTTSSESYAPDSEFNLRPVSRDNWNIWADQYTPGVSNYDTDRSAFGLRHLTDAVITGGGDEVPGLVYSDGLVLSNPDNLAWRAFTYDDRRTENSEDAFRIDLDYQNPFGIDFISSFKAGARVTKAEYEFNHSRYLASDVYKNAFTDQGTANEKPYVVWIDEINAQFPGSIVSVDHHNSFSQSGVDGRNDLLTYPMYNNLADPEATFLMVQQLLAGTNLATTGSLWDNLDYQYDSYRHIEEDTTAFYLSTDLDIGRLHANVGARYIETELTSDVYISEEITSGGNSYDDLLPSLNVSYDLTDNTKLRFAAAKVMRRPNYDELSPAFTADSSLITANRGAIDLDPFRATQYDLSVEHYFGEGGLASFAVFYKDVESFLSSVTYCEARSETVTNQNVVEWETICLLNSAGVTTNDLNFSTLGGFGNDASAGLAFTEAQRDAGLTGIRTSKITNGQNGTVQGFEVGYQQQFTFLPGVLSGLGFNANYTYADSEQPNGNPLLNISKNTFNTQLYWENEVFQVRLAYNFRDEFLYSEEEKRVETIGALALNSATNDETSALYDPTAGNNYRDSRGQLDFSASWDVNDHISLVTSVTNMTGEPTAYTTELGSIWKHTEADRRFAFGVRAKY